ncbi:SCO family protein [Candidatus Mycalebacterium sp.]
MLLKQTVVFFVVLLHCAAAFSITDTAQLKQVGITEKLGEQIPGDISLVNHLGEKQKIGQFFDGRKPVLLNLVFYSCPHNCRFAMQFLTETANALAGGIDSLKIGDDYRVLTVSFDETDTTEIAARKAGENRAILTHKKGAGDLLFFTAGHGEIKRITEAAGFGFRKEGKMFDHQSALIVLTPRGKIARYLYGIQHSPSDLKLALIEASDGQIGGGGIINKVLLFCYKFDPVGKKYALRAINIVKLSGVVTLLILTAFLYRMWRRKA